MKMLPLLWMLLASGAMAQTASSDPVVSTWRTGGHLNGRYWKTLDGAEKLAFVLAYKDASDEAAVLGSQDYAHYLALADILWPTKLTYGEVTSALDAFYLTPENGRIPITDAIEIVSKKARGADEATVQSAITSARARAAKR